MENNNGILGFDDIVQSNTDVEDIVTENVFLFFIAIDKSSSMNRWDDTMRNGLSLFKDKILNSKQVDEILISRCDFDYNVDFQGYKPAVEFKTDYSSDGSTSLYDVIISGYENLTQYMSYLKDQGIRVKAVFSVFSDGDDTTSNANFQQARQKIEQLNDKEITTAFIAFGDDAKSIGGGLGFVNVLDINSDPSELLHAFNCLSKSVISSSQNVNNTDKDDFFQF